VSESHGEAQFLFYLEMLAPDIPTPEREVKFHQTRNWRVDFLWRTPVKLAVEIEGGIYKGGRHVRPAGFKNDIFKYNALSMAGYKLLRFTPDMLDDPQMVLDTVREALAS
jgi:very-short-patch-repair endonuclease